MPSATRLIQRGVLEAAHAANWDRRPEVAAMLARARDAAIAQSFLASHAAPPASLPVRGGDPGRPMTRPSRS